MSFFKVKDTDKIKEILDGAMLNSQSLPGGFVPYIQTVAGVIWNGNRISGPLVIEGARPLSATTDAEGRRSYTLSNSDSDYTRPIGTVFLHEITEIGLL